MRILFTGASSFSGMWFVKELATEGHEIIVICRHALESYTGLRRSRIEQLLPICKIHFNCTFGEDSFLQIIEQYPTWDLFCHHAADVTNYKSADFDVAKALASNTKNLTAVLNCLIKKGCHYTILTGSVFEQGEGAGSDHLKAVSPYGLSKGLTSEFFKYYCKILGMKLGKFVIPNPFGPYEEPKFTSYLIDSWFQGKIPTIATPDYVRDNIPISLLAKAYKYFLSRLISSQNQVYQKFNPSGYVESQGAFTHRFAQEMEKRLNIPCKFECKIQNEFPEPKVRVNTDQLSFQELKWNETEAWDSLATYYKKIVVPR